MSIFSFCVMKVSLGPALVTKNEHFLILCNRSVVTPRWKQKMNTFSFRVMKVSCDPALVTKNEHFLILCNEGQL